MTPRTIPVDVFDLVVFGATGDLAQRKLLPALFHRDVQGQIPPDARIALPAILLEDGHSLTPVIDADSFADIKDVDRLISVLEDRLAKVKHDHPAL